MTPPLALAMLELLEGLTLAEVEALAEALKRAAFERRFPSRRGSPED